MSVWPFAFLGEVLSEEELAALRAASIIDLGEDAKNGFTCDECLAKWTCEFVFDGYNIDGDCLAEK